MSYHRLANRKKEKKMTVIYDTEKIKKILSDLSKITGLSFAFYNNSSPPNSICGIDKEDDEFCHRMLKTDTGKKRCFCADAELIEKAKENGRPVSHICHAGLVDTAVPMIKDGVTVGYIMIGRVRTGEEPSDVVERLAWLGDPPEDIERRYKRLSFFTKERLDSLISLISSILFDGAVRIDYESLEGAAKEFIKTNLSGELSVQILCKRLFISKNQLYLLFKRSFGCTVNEYITDKRIEKAKELLASTKESAKQIADRVGISNYTYFSKLFKSREGLTPMQYRKNI